MSAKEYVVNIRTGQKLFRPEPLNEEVIFDGGVMITETDRRGILVYANKKFCEMTGYTREELIGAPHSVIRHPDMPKGIFKSMWQTVAKGKIWRGYIKNLRKDGKYYWVLVYAQPKYDDRGEVAGYIAGRKVAYPVEVERIEKIYHTFHGDEFADHEIFQCHYSEHIHSRK
ncbi:PAS domain-containing protein [Hydrogenimonas sp.]